MKIVFKKAKKPTQQFGITEGFNRFAACQSNGNLPILFRYHAKSLHFWQDRVLADIVPSHNPRGLESH